MQLAGFLIGRLVHQTEIGKFLVLHVQHLLLVRRKFFVADGKVRVPREDGAETVLLREKVNDLHILNVVVHDGGRHRFGIGARYGFYLFMVERSPRRDLVEKAECVGLAKVGEASLLTGAPVIKKSLERVVIAVHVGQAVLIGGEGLGAAVVEEHAIRLAGRMLELFD